MTSIRLTNVVQQTLLSNSLLWFQSFDPKLDLDLKARRPQCTHLKLGVEMSQKHSC
jgi:hypothetical protein